MAAILSRGGGVGGEGCVDKWISRDNKITTLKTESEVKW